MNRLELCQALCMEAGIPYSNFTTTLNQTGEYARVVGWIDSAWRRLQTKHRDWGWMRQSTSWTTVDGTAEYPLGTGAGTVGVLAANFGMWADRTFRNYPTAVGNTAEIFMSATGYDLWRDTYLYGGTRAARSRPVEFAIGPSKAIYLGPVPTSGYTVTADYFRAPTAMTADTDEPDMPEQFHMILVHRAQMFYGAYESAPEQYQHGEVQYRAMLADLEADRLPAVAFGGPLA